MKTKYETYVIYNLNKNRCNSKITKQNLLMLFTYFHVKEPHTHYLVTS